MKNIKRLSVLLVVLLSIAICTSCSKGNNIEKTLTNNNWIVEKAERGENAPEYLANAYEMLNAQLQGVKFEFINDSDLSVGGNISNYEFIDNKLKITNSQENTIYDIEKLEDGRILLKNSFYKILLRTN